MECEETGVPSRTAAGTGGWVGRETVKYFSPVLWKTKYTQNTWRFSVNYAADVQGSNKAVASKQNGVDTTCVAVLSYRGV